MCVAAAWVKVGLNRISIWQANWIIIINISEASSVTLLLGVEYIHLNRSLEIIQEDNKTLMQMGKCCFGLFWVWMGCDGKIGFRRCDWIYLTVEPRVRKPALLRDVCCFNEKAKVKWLHVFSPFRHICLFCFCSWGCQSIKGGGGGEKTWSSSLTVHAHGQNRLVQE